MGFFTLLPLISSISVFFIGLFIFLQNFKAKINVAFFLHSLAISIWLFGTFMMFLSKNDFLSVIFWDRFIYIGVVFIPVLLYYFVLSYTKQKNDTILYVGLVLSFLFLIASRTQYFVDNVFIYKWGVHTRAYIFHHLFLVYFFSLATISFVKIFKFYKQLKLSQLISQTKYILLGFVILFVVGPFAYLPAYRIGIYPFSYISGLIFTVILAYAIIKYQLFNIKVILTEILVFILWSFILIELSLADTLKDVLVDSFVLVSVVVLGVFLIRSVSNEVSRREETEKLVGELREANDRLRELDQIKSDFISIASHQLRTPLTAIKGYTSMLLEGVYGDVPIKARGIVDKIFQSSQRLVYIVNDMLDVTHIESGRLKYAFEDVRLVNLVNDVVEELKQNAVRKKLKFNFHVDVEDADIIIFADSNKVRQAITNLIDNSIKYTNAGFVFVFISKSEDGKDALLAIKDSGLGMTPDTLSVIFNKFFRAKGALKSHTEGSGLGLYVAREIIRANNGDVWAESEGTGRGSQFYIKLPIKKG